MAGFCFSRASSHSVDLALNPITEVEENAYTLKNNRKSWRTILFVRLFLMMEILLIMHKLVRCISLFFI